MEREPKQIILKLDLTSCRSVKDKAKLKWQRDDVQATQRIFCWWIHHNQRRQNEPEDTLLRGR